MAGIARKIALSDQDRETLLKWKRSPTTPQKLVRRAEIILAAAEGLNNKTISERGLGSVQTVCLWRKRYAEHSIKGLQDEPKAGRPRTIGRDKTAEIVATTLTLPEGVTHWSARRLAKQVGVSHSTVHRIWQAYGLKPHRVETFKFSSDPELKEKVVDMVRAITGWDTSLYELVKVGERAYTMSRAFNAREGFTAADDAIPSRFFEKFKEGPSADNQISPTEFENARVTLSQMMGWDPNTGAPTPWQLQELGVGWIAGD